MPEPFLPKPKRLDPDDREPCAGCSNCCEYVSVAIARPSRFEDFDRIRWYLLHRDVWVWLDWDGGWHLQFNTPCQSLNDRVCGTYVQRPDICRRYEPRECPRYNTRPPEKTILKCEGDWAVYLKEKEPSWFRMLQRKTGWPMDAAS